MVVVAIAIIFLFGAGLATWKSPRLTSIILWSLVTTIFVTAALLLVLPGAFSSKALWIALSVPLIWTACQFWCYYAESPWRVVFTQIGLSITSAIVVLLSTSQS